MLWIAVLWSYVTDAALMLRRWRADRRERREFQRQHEKAWAAQEDRVLAEAFRITEAESVQEWFNRTEGKTK